MYTGKHSAVFSMVYSLRREEVTGPLPGSGPCAHKDKAVLPILFGPAVLGSQAARESEGACRWSISGLRTIVEGPMGNLWSEERSPDEANLLKERWICKEFCFTDSVQVLP